MLLSVETAEPGILQVVLMGIITVFVVLVCLIVLIKILGAIMTHLAPKSAPAPAPQPAAPAPAPAVPAADKGPLVATIAAAIAEDMGTDVDHLRIHSIKRL